MATKKKTHATYAELPLLLQRGNAPYQLVSNAANHLYDPTFDGRYPAPIAHLIADCIQAEHTTLGCNLYGVLQAAHRGEFGTDERVPEP